MLPPRRIEREQQVLRTVDAEFVQNQLVRVQDLRDEK